MKRNHLSLKKAVTLSLVMVIVTLFSLYLLYNHKKSSLKNLLKEVRTLKDRRDQLALKVAMKTKKAKPDKEIGLKLLNSLKSVSSLKIQEVTATEKSVFVLISLPYLDLGTLLYNLEINYPVVIIDRLHLSPLNSKELSASLTLKGFKGKLKSPERVNLNSPWLTTETFTKFLIAIGYLTPPSKPKVKENPPVEPPKEEEKPSLSDIATALQSQYSLRGILIIGSKSEAIFERTTDGKVIRVRSGEKLSITLKDQEITLRVKSITEKDVILETPRGNLRLTLKNG